VLFDFFIVSNYRFLLILLPDLLYFSLAWIFLVTGQSTFVLTTDRKANASQN